MTRLAEEWDAIEVPTKAANLADEWDAIKPLKEAPKETFTRGAEGAKVALHALTGVGSTIVGGWRGLATLASGGTLEDAANAVHEVTQRGTYQPPESNDPRSAAAGVVVLESPYNPMNYPSVIAKKIGEGAQDVRGVSPGAATALETGANALALASPLAFRGRRAPVTIEQPAVGTAKAPAIESVPSQQVPAKIPAEAVPVAAEAPKPANEPTFSEPKPLAEKPLPPVEQTQRAQVLRRIGLSEVRQSVIAGDKKAAATDFQQSRLDNAAGNYMKSVLESEREALRSHAERIVADTGGTVGTDSSALHARGNTILAPLDDLKQWFDGKIKNLYAEADKRAGGVPLEMPKTHEFMGGDQADFLGTTEGEALLKGVKARMKSLGMFDAEGNPQPVTVAQAEKLKQYLGNQWQPRTGRLIRNLKDAIDDDVTSQAGEDIYKQARATRAMRAATLDDPNGIAKVMDASGPEGINRSVAIEKIPDTVTGMSVDQLNHVLKTLNNVPPELKGQAQAAVAEIKAQFANKMLDAGSGRVGQWGARDVTKYLNNNAAKLKQVFTSEELQRINDLNEAGHILRQDQSYPGAAVQEHNLVQRGAMGAIRAGSAAVGGFVGGPFGAAAGDVAGAGIARKFGEKSALKATQKRVVKLSDFP